MLQFRSGAGAGTAHFIWSAQSSAVTEGLRLCWPLPPLQALALPLEL